MSLTIRINYEVLDRLPFLQFPSSANQQFLARDYDLLHSYSSNNNFSADFIPWSSKFRILRCLVNILGKGIPFLSFLDSSISTLL